MIVIRQLHQTDQALEAVYALLTAVYTSSPWTRSQLEADMLAEETTYYLAYEGEALLGVLAVQVVIDEMEIVQLAVHPSARRRGIAWQLLECLAGWSGKILLEVRASNLPAQSLYTRQYFTTIGKRKNYYRAPIEDAVIMMRKRDEG